jgi:hypothetical protein
MSLQEWLERLIPLVIIVLFWPMLFWGVDALWYRYGVYAFAVIGLSWSLYHGISRYRRNLREAQEMMKTQQLGMPPLPPRESEEDKPH